MTSTRPAVVERRDERDHVAVAASLKPFFEPRSVAVIGASPRRGTIGGELFRNILAGDFTGAAYPVNRGGEPVGGVAGLRGHRRRARVVDLAVICVPGAHVLDAARSALATGVKALCVISAGFAETGADGAAAPGRAARARPRARRAAHRTELPRHRVERDAAERDVRAPRRTRRPDRHSPRRAARSVSRSSRRPTLAALVSRASSRSATKPTSRRTTCSSTGRTIRTPTSILLYLESFGNPRKFARVASRVARTKPILAHAERDEPRRRARCELAHRGARGLRRRRRGALLAGGRAARAHARRAARRGRAVLHAAAATRQPRRRRDECRWARDPLRRRLRGRRAVASRARAGDGRSARACRSRRGEQREPGRPARLGDRATRTRPRCRSCSPTRASTP